MDTYYRFQNEKPRNGEIVHCFTSFDEFRRFISYMKTQDPHQFHRMKFWKITGQFVTSDEEDAIIRVYSCEEIPKENLLI